MDNGVTIPSNLRNIFNTDKDSELIIKAISGCSTKHEKGRGFGLGSSLRILTEELNGEVLLASAKGVIYLHNKSGFISDINIKLQGTLISMRISTCNMINNSISVQEMANE